MSATLEIAANAGRGDPTTANASPANRVTIRRFSIRPLLIWALSFLAFPIAGYLGTAVVGRVDNLASALAGGAVVGAIVGFAQALVSQGRLNKLHWTPASMVGASVGLAVGTFVVNYRTSLADLVLAALITGAAIGFAQAFALPRQTRLRWLWVPVTTLLWALGWAVTTLAGIEVDEQIIVFGASGAIVYTVLAGLALLGLGLPTRSKRA